VYALTSLAGRAEDAPRASLVLGVIVIAGLVIIGLAILRFRRK